MAVSPEATFVRLTCKWLARPLLPRFAHAKFSRYKSHKLTLVSGTAGNATDAVTASNSKGKPVLK